MGKFGEASASLATSLPFDLPREDLPVMDIKALPILSLRLRSAEMDFLRDVAPITGAGLPTTGLLRCVKDSVQGGRAVTPTRGCIGLVFGALVCGLFDMDLEFTLRSCGS